MTISKELQQLIECQTQEAFTEGFMKSFIADAAKRNPDVTSDKMLRQLAQPKYNEGIKSINRELDSLKIINRRTEEKKAK